MGPAGKAIQQLKSDKVALQAQLQASINAHKTDADQLAALTEKMKENSARLLDADDLAEIQSVPVK